MYFMHMCLIHIGLADRSKLFTVFFSKCAFFELLGTVHVMLLLLYAKFA